ncbi:MAG TPA: hypothetical protein VGH33_25310, partial [Isosphaeraceae bacterium]
DRKAKGGKQKAEGERENSDVGPPSVFCFVPSAFIAHASETSPKRKLNPAARPGGPAALFFERD